MSLREGAAVISYYVGCKVVDRGWLPSLRLVVVMSCVWSSEGRSGAPLFCLFSPIDLVGLK